MQTALRKMGNSTGMIVPSALLVEIGLSVGAMLDVRIDGGAIIATPAQSGCRAQWAEAAAALGQHDAGDENDWQSFGNDGDDALAW